jgi:iron complex transport system substrate-binding protein
MIPLPMIPIKGPWKLRLVAGLLAFSLVGAELSARNFLPPQTIKDSLNRTVRIPVEVNRVLSLQPEITRLIVALGAEDRLVGIDFFLRNYDHLFKIIAPRQARLPLVSMADYNINLELVIKLAPDLIFGAPEDRRIVDNLQAKTRIPTVALSSMGRFDRLLGELRLVGRLLGREKRAEELVVYFEATLDRVRTAIGSLPPSERRPRVYLSFWGGLTKTPVFYEPVATAGGLNVAEGLLPAFAGTLLAVVGLEQVAAWNPDYILVQGNYPPGERPVTAEAILRDQRLASLEAIRGGRVYYTFGFWNWWDPAQVLVETLYLAKLFHPGLFSDVDLDREGEAIFKKFYGLDGAYAALNRILRFDEWTHDRE